ncbi:AAA family ATPase [Bosea sp. ASV33]|uniref:AAA family ATPase n=1 Tax=Bosea sp. ASV33 TaxID=2795106 RepID=UPI0018EA83B7|nr:AAA family ATPase [Bosea sp. ASV33]
MAEGGGEQVASEATAEAPPPQPLRIESLSLRAYRAFSAELEIPVQGRNLIVYGENGAGKSSIYKALRDLFARRPRRDALKSNAHVHLLDPVLTPRIAVTFNDGASQLEWTEARHPGLPTADSRIALAALRSSFLDYHALLETNAFHGQRRPNLFTLAIEILLADFTDAISGKTIAERWTETERAKPFVHSLSGDYLIPVQAACETFNASLEAALDAMLPIINALLTDLGRAEMRIEAFERGTVRYNDARLKKDRGFIGKELFAKLAFRGYYPQQPQHFLNEARLSALALAFYLAGRLACVPSAPSPALKLLVLDDVLVGLDYANRRPLLAVLEKHFSDWQIVLLTHDRHWFEVVRAAIPADRWTCHEMYEMVAITGEATPYLRPVPSDIVKATLKQAREFIVQKHLPAAANYARSACELLLRKQCEDKKVNFHYKPDPKKITFEQLKTGLEGKLAGDRPKLDALAAITPHQARILNPLSHDPTTSLNEAEVIAAIDAVETLMTTLRS